ncbi:MAG: sugar kinase, partial [Clostridia bacterium]|nr:sugar kinase [Clostridia bacterium]
HRKHAAVTKADENAFDYDAIFDGCSIFHVCGISLALSEQCRNTVFRFAKEAKKRGILISFDFNYRSKLWTIDEARPHYQAFLPYVDICFGNAFDLKNFLSIDEGSLEASVSAFFEKFGAKYLCFNKRNVISSTVNELTGFIYTMQGKDLCEVSYGPCKFEILDRVGGGDCFSAGILHVLNGDLENAQKAVEYGIACDVLKHTIRGDIFTLDENALIDFLNKKTKEIQR